MQIQSNHFEFKQQKTKFKKIQIMSIEFKQIQQNPFKFTQIQQIQTDFN